MSKVLYLYLGERGKLASDPLTSLFPESTIPGDMEALLCNRSERRRCRRESRKSEAVMTARRLLDFSTGLFIMLGLMGLVLVDVVIRAPAAQAITCVHPNGYGINTKADEIGHYGTGSSDIVWHDIPHTGCPVVRSIYIHHDGMNEAEIGWYQDGNVGPNIANCTVVLAPHIFVWELYNNNTYKCKQNTPAYTQTTSVNDFYINEPNDGLNDVLYTWGTQGLGSFNALFAVGQSWAGDEIHDSDTPNNLTAGFAGLTYYGASSNPNAWSQDPIHCSKIGTLPSGWYWHQLTTQHWYEDQNSPGSGC